jgi:phosphoribosylformylglycinamidine synthase
VAASLGTNAAGHFECRWVRMRPEGHSAFADGLDEVELPVAHGEGRLHAPPEVLDRIESEGLVALRYVDETGQPTQAHPANPNGSANAIAGLTDPSGRVIGLMPHPERFVSSAQHFERARVRGGEPDGLRLMRRFLALA